MNVKEAKRIAFGTTPASSLDEWHGAWQWLYDNEVDLQEADMNYMDKLICDGNVIPKSDYFSTIDT